MTPAGFPHSEILGSQLGWQLPEAYRSLLRPSSAPGAKASTVRPYKLGHTKNRTPPPGRKRVRGPTQTLLLTETEDARVHCAVLNVQPDTPHTPPPDPRTPTGDTTV